MPRYWRSLVLLVGLAAVAAAQSYPNYNTSPKPKDSTGMSSTAKQLAAKMHHGFNIGDTLESPNSETGWGRPLITQQFVDFVKASGFNSIRLPIAYNNGHVVDQSTAKIDPTWLARVKEVVNYCIKDGLYVFVNIHWDGGWLEEHCTPDMKDANNAKQKAFWQQIATTLRDFDEHLMFASANEPQVDTAEKMAVLLSYHQTFIDAVRSTGGKNAYRTLIVQGPYGDVEKTYNLMNTLPTDTIANKMIVEVHYYTPWQFCGLEQDESWGRMFYYWGKQNHSPTDTTRNPTWGEEADLDKYFNMMKTKFIDKGIPVIIGEFSAHDRKDKLTGEDLRLHELSRAYFVKTVTQRAFAIGMVPFYWDTGALLDRTACTVTDQQSYDALMQGDAPGPAPTTAAPPSPTTAAPNTTTPAPAPAPDGALLYGQCGGLNWKGPTTCKEGKCVKSNDWYSQCV